MYVMCVCVKKRDEHRLIDCLNLRINLGLYQELLTHNLKITTLIVMSMQSQFLHNRLSPVRIKKRLSLNFKHIEYFVIICIPNKGMFTLEISLLGSFR